jgi:hypothetical protein
MIVRPAKQINGGPAAGGWECMSRRAQPTASAKAADHQEIGKNEFGSWTPLAMKQPGAQPMPYVTTCVWAPALSMTAEAFLFDQTDHSASVKPVKGGDEIPIVEHVYKRSTVSTALRGPGSIYGLSRFRPAATLRIKCSISSRSLICPSLAWCGCARRDPS